MVQPELKKIKEMKTILLPSARLAGMLCCALGYYVLADLIFYCFKYSCICFKVIFELLSGYESGKGNKKR